MISKEDHKKAAGHNAGIPYQSSVSAPLSRDNDDEAVFLEEEDEEPQGTINGTRPLEAVNKVIFFWLL